MEKQLLDYVEQESKRGVPPLMIKKALREAGWDDPSITEAFTAVQSQKNPPLPRIQPSGEDENFDEIDDSSSAAPVEKKKGKGKPVVIIFFIAFILMLVIAAVALWFFEMREPAVTEAPSENTPAATSTEQAGSDNFDIISSKPPVAENSTSTVIMPATSTAVGKPDAIATSTLTSTSTSAVMIATSSEPVVVAATTTDNAAATTTPAMGQADAAARDAQRMNDMRQLASAQDMYFGANNKYYTCGMASGDCGGLLRAYPKQISTYLSVTPQDPSGIAKGVCGTDYVYCGLNNTPYSNFYCYYSKLEGGGYYTASHLGNFKRSTPPKIFEECSVAN